jgi:GT2 family glycosyltransferase
LKLSVIILNYNVCYFLEQSILSVQKAIRNLEAEIIVVDNASNDGSAAMVNNRFPDIIFLQNDENVGFSKANNQAVAIAKGTYVCILNPDTAVAEDTFEYCIQFAESNVNMGALGLYYMDGTGNFLPESKRNLPTPKRSLFKVLGWTQGKYGYYAKQVAKEGVGPVEILAGAFMFLKRELFLEVKGFDEDYFMYGEDIDLCYKLIKLGRSNYYSGLIKVLHYKGESTQRDKAYFDRFYGAMHIFYRKHFSSHKLLNSVVDRAISTTRYVQTRKVKRTGDELPVSDEIWVLTEDLNLLRLVSEQYEIPVRSVALRAVDEDLVSGKMLVFDTHYLSYNQIFEVMSKQKNRHNKFRIRPPGCNFILGSDESDKKGEVKLF